MRSQALSNGATNEEVTSIDDFLSRINLEGENARSQTETKAYTLWLAALQQGANEYPIVEKAVMPHELQVSVLSFLTATAANTTGHTDDLPVSIPGFFLALTLFLPKKTKKLRNCL